MYIYSRQHKKPPESTSGAPLYEARGRCQNAPPSYATAGAEVEACKVAMKFRGLCEVSVPPVAIHCVDVP